MNPDAYFPFYSMEFFAATHPYGDNITISYLHALSYYWHQNHCAGLPNDSGFLHRACHMDGKEWADDAESVIFGVFFRLDQKLWHQNRMRKEYDSAVKSYNARVAAAKTGGIARWKNHNK